MGDQFKKIAEERDAGAFRSVFLTFWPKVRAMLIRQGADRETAEEIAQETMLAVWRKSHLFSTEKGSPSSWIFTIARNLRIDRVRQQAVWQRYSDDFEPVAAQQAHDGGPSPWTQHKGEIEGALGGLPAEQLQVIQLSFVDGLSQSEIAARLDLPLGTVKSRMRLAFQKLRCAVEGGS
jgi:RNA polymerase sigma-70 factor (ECF subfamily)